MSAPERRWPWAWMAAALLGGLLVGFLFLLLKLQASPSPLAPPSGTEPLAKAPPFRVNAELFRAAGTSGEPIVTGGLVRPSDRVFLEIQGDAPMYVYVLDEDDRGDIFVLYPVAGLDLSNPLAPGIRHRLPGRLNDIPQDWAVTTTGGRETILVVASREALPPLEERGARLPSVESGTGPVYAELDPRALEGLRDIAGLPPSREQPRGTTGHRLAEIAQAYRSLAERRDDIWVNEIELVNPR